MCGLVGIMSSNSLLPNHLKMFDDMLYFDAVRGWHSTGVAKVCTNKNINVHKKAMAAMEYMDKDYEDFVNKKGIPKILIGHNRWATQGAVNDTNAHPFTHGDITLVHNGTLLTHHDICEGSEKFDVDSEAICYAIATVGAKEALESLDGAFALVWYDAKDNTLNFARNDQRPLYLATNEYGTALAWASEQYMLMAAIERNNKTKVKYHIEELPVLKHYKYNLTLKGDPIIQDFEEVEWLPPYLRQSNAYYPTAYNSANSSLSKREALRKAYPIGSKVEFVVDSITKQYDVPLKGSITGHIRTKTDPIRVYNVPLSNVKFADWFTGEVAYYQNIYDYKTDSDIIAIVINKVSKMTDGERKEAIQPRSQQLKGPNNVYIPKANWLKLVANGCSMCTMPIDASEHHDVKWMDVEVPLCPKCAKALECE